MPIWLFGITHCTEHEPGSVRSQYVFRCSMIQTAIVAHQPPQKRYVLRYLATTHCQTSSVSLADLHLHFASVVNFADTLGGFHARDSQRWKKPCSELLDRYGSIRLVGLLFEYVAKIPGGGKTHTIVYSRRRTCVAPSSSHCILNTLPSGFPSQLTAHGPQDF